MQFTDQIDKLLKANKMTAKELTQKLNIGATAVTDWKRGKSTPSPQTLIGISQIFDVSIDWLLTGKDEDNEKPIKSTPDCEIENLLSVEEQLLLENYRDLPKESKVELQKKAARLAAMDKKATSSASRNLSDDVELGDELQIG